MIDPALTVSASKHLTYLKHLLAHSRPNEEQRVEIVFHAASLELIAADIRAQASAMNQSTVPISAQ